MKGSETCSPEALVEVDERLLAVELGGEKAHLRVEQRGLGIEHLEIGGLAVVGQEEVGVLYSLFEIPDLLGEEGDLLGALVEGCHIIVDLRSGAEQSVLEVVERLLLLSLGPLEAGNVLSAHEEGRGELSGQLDEPVAGILDE